MVHRSRGEDTPDPVAVPRLPSMGDQPDVFEDEDA